MTEIFIVWIVIIVLAVIFSLTVYFLTKGSEA